MNILHTVEFYPPSTGRVQEAVCLMSERMAAAGHHVTVATTAMPERAAKSWRERFTWERIAQDRLTLYEGLVHGA